MTPAQPRKRPCASCPYRVGVPSGVWRPEEYAKLPPYDQETFEQPPNAFSCHQQDGTICAGWLGFGDPSELLAVRIGIFRGDLDPSCADYTTPVRLFASGAAAAEHGLAEVEVPSERAVSVMAKVIRKRGLT